MRLKAVSVIGMALIVLSALSPVIAQDGKDKDGGYVKVEMTGKLRAYRMLLFGETAATATAGETDIWLDYSKNAEVKKKGIVAFDGKTVVVKGRLKFRDFRVSDEAARKDSGDGPHPLSLRGQPVIVVASLEEAK